MLGLKQIVYCVLLGVPWQVYYQLQQSSWHNKTPLLQTPEAGEQLPERWATLHLYTTVMSMYRCGEMAVHTTPSPNIGWTSGFQHVWENGCAHNPLTQHWGNLRVSAGVGKWLCTRPSHLTLGEPQGFSRCRKMAVHTTLSPNSGWTSGFQQVWGNGCAHDPLTQHWVNLRVSAGLGKQWHILPSHPTLGPMNLRF